MSREQSALASKRSSTDPLLVSFRMTQTSVSRPHLPIALPSPDILLNARRSVNIKMVGDWTKAFGKALGCDPDAKGGKGERTKEHELVADAPMNKVLPRIMCVVHLRWWESRKGRLISVAAGSTARSALPPKTSTSLR